MLLARAKRKDTPDVYPVILFYLLFLFILKLKTASGVWTKGANTMARQRKKNRWSGKPMRIPTIAFYEDEDNREHQLGYAEEYRKMRLWDRSCLDHARDKGYTLATSPLPHIGSAMPVKERVGYKEPMRWEDEPQPIIVKRFFTLS